jgi:glycosyltransferase involved in cell wall biosynthesis
VPLVVTIHELAVLRYPETFNRWTRAYSLLLLPRLARAATRVIAVSEFTAREAVELLGVDERRIRVILEAMASGTPVVTATGSGLADLAAGAAVLVDPLDTDAIAAGIRGRPWRGARSCGLRDLPAPRRSPGRRRRRRPLCTGRKPMVES